MSENHEAVIDEMIKNMLDQGGIKTENIIEVQWIFDCITKNSSIPKENVEKMIGAMEMLINMSNCYLNNYKRLKALPVETSGSESSFEDINTDDY